MNDEEVHHELAVFALKRVLAAFGGALVEHDETGDAGLSPAGILLARFFSELRGSGLSLEEVINGLQQFDESTVAALITIDETTRDSGFSD
jgi:hypothetical protein